MEISKKLRVLVFLLISIFQKKVSLFARNNGFDIVYQCGLCVLSLWFVFFFVIN